MNVTIFNCPHQCLFSFAKLYISNAMAVLFIICVLCPQVLRSHIICCHLSSVYHSSVLRYLSPRDGSSRAITTGTRPDLPEGEIKVRVAGDMGEVCYDNKCYYRLLSRVLRDYFCTFFI